MEGPSVQLMFLILPTPSQSVSGVPRSKDDRQSSVSPQRLSHVRLDIFPTLLIVLFVGRAKQQGQGVSHEGSQAEGRHVSQPWQGEGRVTPANTPYHGGHAKLYRHVGAQGRPQRPVHGEEGVALVYINSAIASARIYMPLYACVL